MLVVQVQRGRFVVILWPRLFVVEVMRVARCDAGASCGLAHALVVVVLWPRLRRVLRAVVIVGGMKCVLFVVVFYVVHVFCLPHCADPDISDTKMEIASKAPYPKPKSRWASHAETPLEQ